MFGQTPNPMSSADLQGNTAINAPDSPEVPLVEPLHKAQSLTRAPNARPSPARDASLRALVSTGCLLGRQGAAPTRNSSLDPRGAPTSRSSACATFLNVINPQSSHARARAIGSLGWSDESIPALAASSHGRPQILARIHVKARAGASSKPPFCSWLCLTFYPNQGRRRRRPLP
jgi:hypothetical protein